MGDQRDVIEILTHDHREVEELFARYESETDAATRKDIIDQSIIELVRHSVAEEEYVYPAARNALPGGGELVEHEIEEHAEAEQIMNDLDGMSADNIEYDGKVRRLIAAIREHVQEEEGTLFPQLRAAMTQDELTELGTKTQMAKKLAPTRPHPMAPDHPPFNKMAAPGAALVDRVRDWITGRGE